jgi:F0F1-type ATP synthase assembly protein I
MSTFRESDANMLRTAWELSAGMLSFVVAIALGWWFGRVLDAWFGTAPWMVRLFTVFGIAAGVLNVKRTLTRALRETRRPPSGGPATKGSPNADG